MQVETRTGEWQDTVYEVAVQELRHGGITTDRRPPKECKRVVVRSTL